MKVSHCVLYRAVLLATLALFGKDKHRAKLQLLGCKQLKSAHYVLQGSIGAPRRVAGPFSWIQSIGNLKVGQPLELERKSSRVSHFI